MNSVAQHRAWQLLWLSLMCCVFEGAVRKWLVGDTSIAGRLAYLSKDIVLAGFVVLSLRSANWLTVIAQPFLYLGMTLLGLGALLSSLFGIAPVGAVLTIVTFFVLPYAAWTGGACLPSDALQRLARWSSVLAVFMCPLAVLQFYSPAESRINRYSTEAEYVATASVSERVRATGTFSYLTGLGEFSAMGVWAGLFTFSTAVSARERVLGCAGLIAAGCCSLVTVSRSVAINSIGIVAIWIVFGGQIGRKMQAAALVAIALYAALTATDRWQNASEISSTVYLRHAAGHDTLAHRLWYQYVLPLNAIGIAPIGNGLGSEQAGRTLNRTTLRQTATFESPWGRTVMELGIAGLLGFLISWGIAFATLRAVYRVAPFGGAKAALAVTGAALAFRALAGFQFNHVAAYFFWSMTACVLAYGNAKDTIDESFYDDTAESGHLSEAGSTHVFATVSHE